MNNEYENCLLCGRACGKNRREGELGYCKMLAVPTVARAALHAWEEPCISGTRGSGTVFFTGCSLGCIFCQNREISGGKVGRTVSDERLSEIMLELQASGAHNINFVTPTHFAPSVVSSVKLARERGMSLPIVYNTSSYDSKIALRMLEGTVDVYLADYKYHLPKTAGVLSNAENYPEIARAAIAEMVRQKPTPVIEDGIMRSGVIVRLLLLPGKVAEAKLAVKYLHDTYGDAVYLSLMSQYTPMPDMPRPLDRTVTRAEYSELVDYAIEKGITRAFVQDGKAASESFIPAFDLTGV
ncbi:MAG: radical SAM protein [Clostridia bacterium]|nr:radical SAM protein [Clostridia bacterium]